ncbi:MAG: DsrE/DsrF/DrsH-like family protein [Rhodospirillaceae bacterium]|nr:DsrE/DsrF/DrsH-like family protein [Rhodospirillales bacterium]
MPAAEAPAKLSIVVFSGEFDRVHYALVMAAAAVATNTPVTLFFTMGAAKALKKDGGWRTLPGAAETDAGFQAKNLATFEDLLEACVALGVTFMVCEMGLKALGMDSSELRDDVPLTQGGVVTFLADASKDGAMLFV